VGSLIDIYRHFGGTYCIHRQCKNERRERKIGEIRKADKNLGLNSPIDSLLDSSLPSLPLITDTSFPHDLLFYREYGGKINSETSV
jgi:hypothetical protein